MTTIQKATLETLRQYDTPTVCNVIELFDVRPHNRGYMDSSIKAAFPDFPPMVGFAATITTRTFVKKTGTDSYAGLADQVDRFGELSGPPVLMFQDLDGTDAAATFGEVMCTTYKTFGAVGLVTTGPGRDLDQVREIGFPVFCNGTVCSHGYNHMLDIHVPVQMGGITIYPNDLIHGDLNGVTTIPNDIAPDVADICQEFVAIETTFLNTITQGTPSVAILREANTEKSESINKLAQRLTSRN